MFGGEFIHVSKIALVGYLFLNGKMVSLNLISRQLISRDSRTLYKTGYYINISIYIGPPSSIICKNIVGMWLPNVARVRRGYGAATHRTVEYSPEYGVGTRAYIDIKRARSSDNIKYIVAVPGSC
jgi:hypothetical protein